MPLRPTTYADIEGTLAGLPGAKRDGAGWRVPCPVHNGEDANLHVWPRDDGTTGAACHSHGCRYGELLQAVEGLAGIRPESHSASPYSEQRPASRRATRPQRKAPDTGAYGRSLWQRASPAVVGTPAHRYLAQHRRVWRDDARLPAALAWIPVDAVPARCEGLHGELRDAAAAGLLLAAYGRIRWQPAAIECEALTADGQRTTPRLRRTWGKRKGQPCELRALAADCTGGLIAVEGIADGCAALMVYPGVGVWVLGGKDGYRELPAMLAAADVPTGTPLRLFPDGDRVGRQAGQKGAVALARRGYHHVLIDYQTRGCDLADVVGAMGGTE